MLKTIPYLINNQLSPSNVKPTSDSVAQTKPVAIMSPGSRIKYRRQLAIGSKSGAVRRGGSSIAGLFCPSIATGCHGSRSSSLSALVSIMALIASALVINLVIGQPIQPADGQSEAPTVSSGLATTTSATSSSSSPLGSRGIKRASQQGRQAAQQVLGLDQQQQQPQRQLTVGNGMAPFYSIKDGKTSARRIQQQQPSSPSTIQRNVSPSAASRGISSGNGAVSQSLRQNPLANDDGQRELAPQDMMTQDWRQTMTSGGATSVGGGGGATDYESDGLGEMMAGQEGVTTSGRTTTTPITSTGVSASDESSSADDSAENEVPAARTTSSSSANGKTKPAEFNQLAPMSVQQQQQQQLANMMTIGSFNQLVGSSGADRLADFKPSNSQTGEQSMDSDEETDDRQQLQQQRQIQSATSGAADGFPALSSSSLAGNNGEPTTATTTDNNNNNRLQSTLVSNESADFRQQPTPIKQSVGRTQGTKQPGTKPAQRKQQKQQQQQQQTSSMPNSMQSIQQQETPGANSGGQLQASSLSMSLDGMIVNSRPRASGSTGASANEQLTATTSSGGSNQRGGSNQQNLKSSSGGNKSSQQQQSRLASSRQQPATNTFSLPPPTTTMATTLGGDSRTTQNVGVGAGQQQNGQSASAAGNVRRVPFSGAPFSSPASKGQRTKPKASNQFGGFSSAPANAPESLTSNQQQLQQQQVDSMSSGGQNGVVSERPSQAGFTMATLVGDNNSPNSLARGQQQLGAGDEDQQQKVSAVNVVEGEQQISNGGEELINSVMQSLNSMTNNGQTMRLATTTSATDLVDANMAPRFNQVATSKLPNGDMLMSVISSDDGRERKLVMISRDTLDSLQRFADQQQQDQQQTQQQPQQQQRITDVDSPAGVSSSGANMANWWPTTTTSTTVSTPTGGAQRQFDQSNMAVNSQRQQQQRQQTTTMMPISFSTSVAATQAPSFDTTDGFGSSTVVPSNDLGATMSGAGVASGSTTLSETTGNKNADTFREVSIQQANTTNGQQQQQVANKERLPGQAPAAKGSMRQQQKQQQQAGGSSRTNTVTTTSTAGSKQQQVSGTKTTKAKSKQTATGASSNGSGSSSSSSSLMVNGNDNGSARQQAQKQQQTLVDGEQANGNTSAGQRPVSTSSDSSSLSNGSVQIGSTSESGTSRQNGIVNSTKSKQKKTQQANNNGSRSSGRKQESTQGATATTTTATTTMAGVTTTTPTTTTKRTKSGGKTQKSQSSSGKQKQQAGSSKSASKNQSSRKQWATTSSSSGAGAANGDTTTGSVGSVATQTSVNQQQQTTTTQAPDLAPTVGTNGQQLPKGRLSGVTQSSVELDSSKGPSIDGGSNRPSVDILETNRRGENESVSLANETTSSVRPTTAPSSEMAAPGGSLGGGVSSSSSSRTELDRQLDEMERANAADADNQAAAMLDSERQGGQQQQRDGSDGTGAPISELDGLRAAVPGEPLVDYPIYSEPPARSSFQCQAQSCPGGYYADPDSQCQVFHVCQNDGRMDTFLCPNGTIFSQQHFVCVWWWQVDCSLSRSFYKLNDAIYCNAMTLPIDSNELTSPGDGGLVVADNSRQSPGATSSSGSADGTSSSIQDTDSGSPVGSANFNAATLQQQRQQQQQQQQTTKQRPLAGNHRSNNNNSGVIAGTPRTLTDGTTSTSTTTAGRTTSTMPTNTGGRLSLVGPQSARQPQQQSITTTTASRRVNSNNQFDGSTSTSTQVTLTNLLQDDQDQEPGQVARNQTGQANGGQLNDNDMNQQQQQQLELLSRRAA